MNDLIEVSGCNQLYMVFQILFLSRLLLLFLSGLLFLIPCQIAYATEAEVELAIIHSVKMQPMAGLSSQQCHGATTDDSVWPKLRFSAIQPQQHLCIRAVLDTRTQTLPDNPALFLAALAAYEVRINGELLGRNGVVGGNADTEQVGAFNSIFSLDSSQLPAGQHLLSIELSSFLAAPQFAAIAYLLMVLDQQALSDTILQVSLVTAALLGGLLMLFMIFMVLYVSYRRHLTYCIFSMLCFATGLLLVAEQWKLWVNYAYDWHLLRLQIIILITLLVTFLLPVYYLWQHQISEKRYWVMALGISQTGAVFFAQSYDARSEWLFVVSLLFVLAINLVAFLRHKPFAKTAVVIACISLLSLFVTPTLFLELGFGLAICLVLGSIGLALLQQLRQQRDRALQTGRVKGELLRRNLQPHYLMNCLMQVQELIDVAPVQANAFVAELAEEFRALVKMSAHDVVPLQDEIALCQKHLNIMSIRYQQNYQFVVEIAPEEQGECIMVPAAILHSQIENCFTHNRIDGKDSLQLQVSHHRGYAHLLLKTPVADSVNHQGLGIGEAYIRAKLAEVCCSDWQLVSYQDGGFWITRYCYRLRPDLSKSFQIDKRVN